MKVVPGPASNDLGSKIGRLLSVQVVPVEFKQFPDGESYLRLTKDLKGEDVVIVETTAPPQDTNLIHLLLLIDAARDLGAKSITAVVPYVAYGRQDSRYRPGEAITSKTVFKLLEDVGADYFITVNFHSPDILQYLEIPYKNLSAISFLADYMTRFNLKEAFSLAPDEGAIKFVEVTSKILGGQYGWLKKKRDRVTGEIAIETSSIKIKGNDSVIFDDIISTGSTMIAAIKVLKALGSRRVYVACVHPLLIGDSRERILKEGVSKIVGTNCVQSPVSVVSVAPLIAEALKKWFPV